MFTVLTGVAGNDRLSTIKFLAMQINSVNRQHGAGVLPPRLEALLLRSVQSSRGWQIFGELTAEAGQSRRTKGSARSSRTGLSDGLNNLNGLNDLNPTRTLAQN